MRSSEADPLSLWGLVRPHGCRRVDEHSAGLGARRAGQPPNRLGKGCGSPRRSVDLDAHCWVPVEVIVDAQRFEVRLAELDLPTFGLPLELLELVRALALAHEVEVVAGVFFAHE